MHSARPLSVSRPLSLSPIITPMTDRQTFPFDGAGDFRGEPKSCSDDPPLCVRVCVSGDVCMCVLRVGCHREGCLFSRGCKMMLLIQLNDGDEDGGPEDDADGDDYLGGKVCRRCVM